jgi:YHS domain-containing protein
MLRLDEKRRAIVAALLGAGLLGLAASAHAGSTVYGAAKGPAIGGYDPVAYFTDGAPKEGDPRHTLDWNGAIWRFASAENRERFKAEPERYAPQYGGYCAYAMSTDSFSPGDAKRWRIEGGKLYLNANILAQTLWENNIPKRVLQADGHWPARKQELEAKP